MDAFAAPISRHIWETRYRLPSERTIDETRRRIARALATAESQDQPTWEDRFAALLEEFRFLPGGRIHAGAGAERRVTLFNCFVMGTIEDSLPGIFRALEESAVTMQQGGGVGLDFSTLRPAGSRARHTGQVASGPVSFMHVWDAMCATILSTGARRGAMMGTLRCDHPDIEAFIDAKREPGRLARFNLSVLVTDGFMNAVRTDGDWPLVFPAEALDGEGGVEIRDWPAHAQPVACRVVRRLRARALWEKILRTAYDCAEPGVLFIDRINQLNNLGYCERIIATNPCGEIPLPAYGACDLGSLNLTRFIRSPFTGEAGLDLEALAAAAKLAVRLLDDVVDVSRYPLQQQASAARSARRLGLGITGLADGLLMLGQVYGAPASLATAASIMRTIRDAAYEASVELAREKGVFPLYDRDLYLDTPFIRALPQTLRDAIAAHGVRNSHLLAIAPAGTISLLAGAVSSGLEPIFSADYERAVLDADGRRRVFRLTDYAVAEWRRTHQDRSLPPAFASVEDLGASAHFAMLATLQPFVDNSISKTINLPAAIPFEAFCGIYDRAWDEGLKGCTAFRPNPVTGQVLVEARAGEASSPCCDPEREGD